MAAGKNKTALFLAELSMTAPKKGRGKERPARAKAKSAGTLLYDSLTENKDPQDHGLEDIDKLSDMVTALIQNTKAKKQEVPVMAPAAHSTFGDVFGATALEGETSFFQSDDRFMSNSDFAVTKRKTDGPLRVAAYIRVSTENIDQEDSYETQERYFMRLLSENIGWVSAGIYSDYGISGTIADKRRGFKRIIRHCKEGKIDRIVTKSISRFARNTQDFMLALSIIKESGVSILFEKENLDTADPTSEFILTTLGAIAQEESRSIAENIRWGYQKRYPMGEVKNVVIYGYRYAEGEDAYEQTESGYKLRKVEIVEEEAAIVRRIFREAAQGDSFVNIARRLNQEYIPGPTSLYNGKAKRMEENRVEKGRVRDEIDRGWTAQQIGGILRKERYMGAVLMQKFYAAKMDGVTNARNEGELPKYLVEGHHPAIITKALFEEVQIRLESQKVGKREPAKRYPFSKRLICGDCGRYLQVANQRSNLRWFCKVAEENAGKVVCRNERIYEEQIIRAFRKGFLQRFELVRGTVKDDSKKADILSGRFENVGVSEAAVVFTKQSNSIIPQMKERLRSIQRNDNMERDRAMLKRQLQAVVLNRESWEKKVRQMESEKDNAEVRYKLLSDGSISGEEMAQIFSRLEEARAGLESAKADEAVLMNRLEKMEQYWMELEQDYDWREKAIYWMDTLDDKDMIGFLNGLTSEYVKAFALSITVYSPLRFSIHWFDDTYTEVVLDSNIEDMRRTAQYFDGHVMRDKPKRKRK